MTRREFFRSGGRYLLLGALGLMAGRLAGRGAARPGDACVRDGICRRCSRLDDCGAPQALSARRVLRR